VRRRELITLLGGAVATWPLAARGQQTDRMRRVGVLMPAAADNSQFQSWVGAFLQGLGHAGWTIGRNVRIDTRWATFNADDIRRHAAELVSLAPDVILAFGASTMPPLLQATRAVPIVFVNVVDPVGAGFVDGLSRPGGNATGFTSYEYSLAGKMAGATKADSAGRDASGGPAGSRHTFRALVSSVSSRPRRGRLG
jgi:ABC-type uncharacterized transport system substrate-binding protein